MEADVFLSIVMEPIRWSSKSIEMRRAADVVWDRFVARLVDALKAQSDNLDDGGAWEEAIGYLDTSKMLYGYALETAFKGYIIEQEPDKFEIETTTDEAGEVLDARTIRIGVPLRSGHELVELAEHSGAFTRGEGAIFSADSDYIALHSILVHLTEYTVWRGRYPVPIRSGPEFAPAKGMPVRVLGHYLRDWVDPVLDRYQGRLNTAGPAEE